MLNFNIFYYSNYISVTICEKYSLAKYKYIVSYFNQWGSTILCYIGLHFALMTKFADPTTFDNFYLL